SASSSANGASIASGSSDIKSRRDLLAVVSCSLSTLFGRMHDSLPGDPKAITAFHSMVTPSMTIQDYFQRFIEHSNCSAECCIIAVVNLHRIHLAKPTFPINGLTIHRLL